MDILNTNALNKAWVGFSDMFDRMEQFTRNTTKEWQTFPPYNVRKVDDNHFVIEFAVAGFAATDINITVEGDQLVVSGSSKDSPEDGNYIFKGIAERTFRRSFTVHDVLEVKNATMVNGMLKIWLEKLADVSSAIRKVEIKDAGSEKSFLTE